MKFNIVGLEDSFGSHRFSNNDILKELESHSRKSDCIDFVWWVEKIFTKPEWSDKAEELRTKPWFGVMHVPLLTPNWAMYSQNDISSIYFSKKWREALKTCRGIIVLSEHMKRQLNAVYPWLNVFYLKHPIGRNNTSFNYKEYEKKPTILMVGAWLRNFDSFLDLDFNVEKKILLNTYAEGYLRDVYSKYSINILSRSREVTCINFLEDEEYDNIFTRSLIFLDLHETSANNAVCECLSFSVPFVATRHPAIEEYVGSEYPLFLDKIDVNTISNSQVLSAHKYLSGLHSLRNELDLTHFIKGVKEIYKKIF
ncbi:TPA: hypothetical protein NJ353_003290 [Vibrio parahaemolyticus]|uniref:Glycosyltransferase n=1 Tax=Vibrio parahaemolyticus TaxID=670 RepID=A0A7M1VW77_VIBPH|nr:hypothetical protein VP46_00047 [Vibrio parahaemolyticus]QOS24425.1 hypothetical protein VP47_00047 [Vibrio parahaemolyticus]HCE1501081.1 hypothetical protein [Vibrio parahaemolyticus]HCG7082837.1 hypothetical protein [Vibrio parahaemolyticus]HCH0724226.1 hypothetical protein [Vibrio parahaemolyticus]